MEIEISSAVPNSANTVYVVVELKENIVSIIEDISVATVHGRDENATVDRIESADAVKLAFLYILGSRKIKTAKKTL